ncbi:MAG: DUF2993 domain-containing protein [Selenomonadaceae bacterium]|nr:DUF2993 domain-containing protein [Selenomonadaceae bacterium]
MRKFLVFMAGLFLILVVLLEVILPKTLSNVLETQITNLTGAQEVDLDLSSSPNLKIAVGNIDKIHVAANLGRIGDVDFKTLTLDGENISVDVPEILFPSENLSSQERTNKILKSADKIEMHGIITAEDIKSFIAKKVDKFDNAEVNISPEGVAASGEIKIMGRMAEVEMAGTFVEDNGNIYFRGTSLNIKNSLLRHIQLDRFFGDVKILDADKLPLNLKYDSVELRENEILITAKMR